MYSDTEMSFSTDKSDQLFGATPPKGVYFHVEFEHNLQHPRNRDMNPEDRFVISDPLRRMDEARVIAKTMANDLAMAMEIAVIDQEMEEDEDGVDLPAYLGVDSDSEDGVVFWASVRFIDYRHETIH